MGFFDRFKTATKLTESAQESKEIAFFETKIRKSRLNLLKKRYQKLQTKLEELEMEEDIANLEDEINYRSAGDEQEEGQGELSADALVFQMISSILQKKMPSTQPPPPVPPSHDLDDPQMSDDELRQMKAGMRNQDLKRLKKLSDEKLKEMARLYVPSSDEKTLERAITILRE